MEAFVAQKEEETPVSPRKIKLKDLLDKELNEQKLARKLLENHFRINNAELRRIASNGQGDACIKTWGEQINRKLKEEEEEKMRRLEAQADEAEEAERKELELQEKQRRDIMERQEHLKILQRQIDEIRSREEESKYLVEEERKLAIELNRLERLEEERKAIEEKFKRELYGKALLKQHQAALRRKSALVQAELEADLNWLAQIEEQNQDEEQRRVNKQQQERSNLDETRDRIQKELEIQRRREMELDALQTHEVDRIWARKEAEWRKETEARQKLLKEVLEERRAQVFQKLEDNRRRQHEELETRESLLEALEEAHRNRGGDKYSDQGKLASTEAIRRDLESQIAEKQYRKLEAKRTAESEEKAEREAERAYEEMLRQEAERLKIDNTRKSSASSSSSNQNPRRGDFNHLLRSRPGGNIW